MEGLVSYLGRSRFAPKGRPADGEREVIYEKGSQEGTLPLAAFFVPPLTCFLPPAPSLQEHSRCARIPHVFVSLPVRVIFVFSHLFWLSKSSVISDLNGEADNQQIGPLRSMTSRHASHHENCCARHSYIAFSVCGTMRVSSYVRRVLRMARVIAASLRETAFRADLSLVPFARNSS